MVSGLGRDMCETMTDADTDASTEPKATPWPKVSYRKKVVEWPPEQDESTWPVTKQGEPGEE
jgi:hypothetical protein